MRCVPWQRFCQHRGLSPAYSVLRQERDFPFCFDQLESDENFLIFFISYATDLIMTVLNVTINNSQLSLARFTEKTGVSDNHQVNWVNVFKYYFVTIRDTKKDGATRCILGRSTCRPQIYSVCKGT